ASRRRRRRARPDPQGSPEKIRRHQRASGSVHQRAADEKQHAPGDGRLHLHELRRSGNDREQLGARRRQRRSLLSDLMKFPAQLLAVLALAAWMGAPRADAAPLRIAYSSISGAMLPLWVAKERKLFEKYGVDVELAYIRGVAIEAL